MKNLAPPTKQPESGIYDRVLLIVLTAHWEEAKNNLSPDEVQTMRKNIFDSQYWGFTFLVNEHTRPLILQSGLWLGAPPSLEDKSRALNRLEEEREKMAKLRRKEFEK